MISGQTPTGGTTGTIEVIDFAEPSPRWRQAGMMAVPLKDHRGNGERRDKGDKRDRDDEAELRVIAPNVPAQAVPGIYMLFVVDRNGVPSVGKKMVLEPETRGRSLGFK